MGRQRIPSPARAKPKSWRGRRLVVTAGPTREPIDPVRYISNASSGRMGFALAGAARRLGARVTLVSGPTAVKPPRGVKVIRADTALDMLRETLRHGLKADAVIGAAAVADWRPARASAAKLKKKPGTPTMTLRLRKNPDILKTLARRRRKAPRPVLAGFALETENLLANAGRKLREKSLDLIVANTAESIEATTSRAYILRPGIPPIPCPLMNKTVLAGRILRELAAALP